jgi:hypothetical protein
LSGSSGAGVFVVPLSWYSRHYALSRSWEVNTASLQPLINLAAKRNGLAEVGVVQRLYGREAGLSECLFWTLDESTSAIIIGS